MNLRILPLSQPDRPARFGCFRPSRGLRGTSEAARLVLASPHVNDARDALGSKMPPDLGKSARYHQQSMDFAPKKDVHGVLKTFTKPMDGYYGTDVSYTNVPMGFDWYQKNIEAIENCRRGLHTDTHMWLDQWLFMY